MLITNANSAAINTAKASTKAVKAEKSEVASENSASGDTFKKTVTGAAYAAGGALGGMALGAVTGEVMSHLTKNEIFSTFGGGVGAVGGAATTLALSLSDENVSISRTFGAWAGSAAGAAGGMHVLGTVGEFLASHGAHAMYGSHGAMLGALGAGIAGAGIAFAGDEGKVGTAVKSAAKGSTGVVAGFVAGGGVQALFNHVPALAPMAAAAPVVAAATLGLIGVQNELNAGWNSGRLYKPNVKALDVATRTSIGSATGLGAGLLAGAIGYGLTGAGGYGTVVPAVATGVGALASYAAATDNKLLSDVAVTGGIAGAAGVVGDAIGRGLTALTGEAAFTYLGAAAGAVTGATITLSAQDRLNGYVSLATAGTVGGTVAGTLLGTALTALTGSTGYQLAGSAIGAAAGMFLGLAGAAHMADEDKKAAEKKAAEQAA